MSSDILIICEVIRNFFAKHFNEQYEVESTVERIIEVVSSVYKTKMRDPIIKDCLNTIYEKAPNIVHSLASDSEQSFIPIPNTVPSRSNSTLPTAPSQVHHQVFFYCKRWFL